MGITAAEIKHYPPTTRDDTSSNGGRMNDAAVLTTAAKNNQFASISSANFTAGFTDWVKEFERVEDSEEGSAGVYYVYLGAPTSGATQHYLVKGSQTDTQGAMATSDLHTTGALDAGVSAGAGGFDVSVEDGAVTSFRNGDVVVIYEIGSGSLADPEKREFHTLDAAPSVAGSVVTLSITGTLANAYTTAAFVGSVVSFGATAAGYSGVVETTGAGTFDEAQIDVPNQGSIYQSWTLTFTSATAFSVSGDTVGALAAGAIGSSYAPTNPNTGTPYFTIPSAAWGGTWASADTVVFVTTPFGVAYWIKQVVPAASSASSAQSIDTVTYLEAA